MKTNLRSFTTILILIPLSYFLILGFAEHKEDSSKKIAYNFVKCTSAKFMLNVTDTTKQLSPLFENLGEYTYTISTENERAQKFFNQGIRLTFAFNHSEAHRSFMEASRLDPSAAMTYWGQAYTLGPNINDPQPDEERKKNYNEAMVKARELAWDANEKERALIQALSHRYSTDLNKDVRELNVAYMNAMAKVVGQYPDDSNILVLYAAAVMNTVPWNYWDKRGNPSPNIPEAKAALEKAMQLNPNHPGAHHYYIHMVELPKPELGVPSADKLGALMPGAGHLIHMPSHIYIRVGRYEDAVRVNQQAILADEDYISQCFSQGMYPLGYYPHNIHFLWSAASLLGDSSIAIDAAKKTAEKVPVGELIKLPFLQNFVSTPLLAYTRFGKWNEILTIPKPNDEIKHLKLIWHYARGIAFTRKNNFKDAREELDAIGEMINDPDLEELVATGFDSTKTIAELAFEVVAGELAAAEGNLDLSIEHLNKAVKIEDGLIYNEPAAWHIPVRQNLGAVLLKANNFQEAEQIYKEDLKTLRQNGWSLMGLYQSLIGQDKLMEAKKIRQEYELAWKRADIKINTSIL